MPAPTLARVKVAVVARYPDNYSMQKLLLLDQVESYEYLATYHPAGVPADVLPRITASIVARYPDNYSMQKLLVEDQVQSYRALHP